MMHGQTKIKFIKVCCVRVTERGSTQGLLNIY